MQGIRKQRAFPRLSNAFWGVRATHIDRVLCPGCGELHPEAAFKALLVAERKRTERTRRAFSLSLIDVQGIVEEIVTDGNSEAREALAALLQLLITRTRDIDIKGWYDEGRLVGVIWPETDSQGQAGLESRLRGMLDEAIGADFHSRVGVMWYAFPSDEPPGDGARTAETKPFYADAEAGSRGKVRTLLKRLLDIGGALTALIALSPLLTIVAVLIRLTSPGPIFFRQERVGSGGKAFTFLKFRSMYVDCDQELHRRYVSKFIQGDVDGDGEGSTGVYKITNDPRVTRIGRVLRRTSLDELPQFFNVLAGHMSLVGPRPPIPYEMSEYKLWHRCRVMEAKPGITGPWQVEGRSATTFDAMVRMDIRYMRTWSLWSDVKLILKTPLVLLAARGAY